MWSVKHSDIQADLCWLQRSPIWSDPAKKSTNKNTVKWREKRWCLKIDGISHGYNHIYIYNYYCSIYYPLVMAMKSWFSNLEIMGDPSGGSDSAASCGISLAQKSTKRPVSGAKSIGASPRDAWCATRARRLAVSFWWALQMKIHTATLL